MDDYNLPPYRDVASAILGVCRTNSSTRSACQCYRRWGPRSPRGRVDRRLP